MTNLPAVSLRRSGSGKNNYVDHLKINIRIFGVLRLDRVRNEEVRMRAGIERELASRADQRVLGWFGHVERMDEYRMARKGVDGRSKFGTGTRETKVRLDGWCEGGLGQERNDGGGYATMYER